MKKWLPPFLLVFSLAACGTEPPEPETEGAETEVSAPQGELDPTAPEEVDEAEAVSFSAIVNGEIEEGAAVIMSGTVREVTDDGAFPVFILADDDNEIFVRNMAETPATEGETVTIHGIFEGINEENMPTIAASVIDGQQ